MLPNSNGNDVLAALNNLIDSTLDFINCSYIKNSQHKQIVNLQDEIREKTMTYVRAEEMPAIARAMTDIHLCTPILNTCDQLKKLLQSLAMQLTDQLFRENVDATLLSCIKTYSLSSHYDLLAETLDKFKEYADHILELCRLLRHVSELDVFEVTCEHHYAVFNYLTHMIQSSAGTAALYPNCRSAVENLNLYCECWENQINEFSVLVKEMQEFIHGIKSNKSVYLSLPRPGVILIFFTNLFNIFLEA